MIHNKFQKKIQKSLIKHLFLEKVRKIGARILIHSFAWTDPDPGSERAKKSLENLNFVNILPKSSVNMIYVSGQHTYITFIYNLTR